MIVGADTGGTFTDLVDGDGTAVKVLSCPDDPAGAVGDGLSLIGADVPQLLSHGTTIATNTLLERSGAGVALLTTSGMEDVIEIGRQDRPALYDPFVDRPPPLVPRELRFGLSARLDAHGHVLRDLDLTEVPSVPAGIDTLAVCLLHADLDPSHERAVANHFREAGLDVTCSHEVSPEFREYERTVTTVANAFLRPRCHSYLRSMASFAHEVAVMTSAGGLMSAPEAAELPVTLLLSGPAAGAQAAADLAGATGFSDAVSFDMGGTSTDVCLIRGGRAQPSPQIVVGGYPIRIPALDIHTIGAGGGSIAALDPGGALVVGPRSAGAAPGPACYGRGGHEPTVTDADLLLGRIPPDDTHPVLGRLDIGAARDALSRAGVDPGGVVRVVDTNMVQAVRRVTVERGVDPRTLALVAFGGAGPLHACAVADALDMPAVVVPPRAGVFSAVGLLTAPRRREFVRSWATPRNHADLEETLEAFVADITGDDDAAHVTTALDCRYAGQSHEISVPDVDAFHHEHAIVNGFDRPDVAVEVVALRARVEAPPPLSMTDLRAVERVGHATGPCTLAEADCTVWLPDRWHAELHETGAWILRRNS